MHSRSMFLASAAALAALLAFGSAAQAQHKPDPEPASKAPMAAASTGSGPTFSPPGKRFIQTGGENIYQALCQGCHMAKGEGAKGVGFYPALANNPRLASGMYPMYVILKGFHGMPSFAERLDDQQVADVVNYVRTSFGNNYTDALKPEDVKQQR